MLLKIIINSVTTNDEFSIEIQQTHKKLASDFSLFNCYMNAIHINLISS